MENEEKAKELAHKNKCSLATLYCSNIRESALEMAKWKEEQMIDKACEWLMKYKDNYAEFNVKTDEKSVSEDIVYDFKKAMKE